MTHVTEKKPPAGKPTFKPSGVFRQAEADDSAGRADLTADLLGQLDDLDQQAGRAEQALEAIARSISSNATNPQFFYHLACTLRQRGRWQHAVDHFRRAIQIQPGFVEAYVGLGTTLHQQGRLDDAAATLRQALDLRPDDAAAHVELAAVLHAVGDRFLATEHLYGALCADSQRTEAWSRLGGILLEQGETAEALDCFATALRREKADPQSRYTAALIALQRGDFAAGWEGFELRKSLRGESGRSTRKEPAWGETRLRRQSVLVRSEGNVADDLMFASCLNDFIPCIGRCSIQCDPALSALFARSFPAAIVVPADEPLDATSLDAEVLLGSLPRHFRDSPERFPTRRGYLIPDPARRRHWQRRLDGLGEGLKVGIAWRGERATKAEQSRIPGFESWRPLLETAGVEWVSLQDGGDNEMAELAGRLGTKFHTDFHTFAQADLDDMAALVSALDLVIAVPDRMAHLAGALGANVWAPLSSTPSWRWMLHGDSTPWFPSTRLYRQHRPGCWDDVFAAMGRDLASHTS